jgi:hypothetical protein
MARIQLRRGAFSNIPTSGNLAGEPIWTTDRRTLHVAVDATTVVPATPAIEQLSAIGAVDVANDLLLIHDQNSSGQKEKKITVQDFKTALNIPESSTDEKVAVVSGGTAGYLWGTNGTDGVLRMGAGMTWTKDSGNAYVTLIVDVVDGGTF